MAENTVFADQSSENLTKEIDYLYSLDENQLLLTATLDFALLETLSSLFLETASVSDASQTIGAQTEAETQSIDSFYRKYRKKVIEKPSKITANTLRKFLPYNGEKFCKDIQYCKNKAKANDLKKDLKQALKDATKISMWGGAIWIWFKKPDENINTDIIKTEDIKNTVEATEGVYVEVVNDALDSGIDILLAGTDTVIPLSFIVMITKGSLNELCPCCEKCEGKGKDDANKICEVCKGTGSKTPFS